MASMIEVNCKKCQQSFMARVADRKRGWGKFCNKSCKAKEQENRTGQYRSYINRVLYDKYAPSEFSNAHQFSNEE